MYTDFVNWFSELEAYKLGCTVGFCLGLLAFFIIQAVVEYAVDLFHKKYHKS